MARSGWARALAAAACVAFVSAAGVYAGTCSLPAWGAAPSAGVDAYGSAVTGCNGLLYKGGGYSFSQNAYTPEFRSWNPATNTWTTLAPMPTPREMATLLCDAGNNRLFLMGGYDAIAAGPAFHLVHTYNIATNTWTPQPDMPMDRQSMASAVIGNLAYLAGGYTDGFVDTSQSTVHEFNLTTMTFTPRANMPEAFGGAGGSASAGFFYVMGGRDLAVDNRATVYEFNPTTNTWVSRAPIPTAVNVPAAVSLGAQPQCNGDIILIGGGNPFLVDPHVNPSAVPASARAVETTGTTQIYDRVANTWGPGPSLPTGRSFIGAGQAGNALIAVGGYSGASSVSTADRIQGVPLPVGLHGFTVQ